MPAVNLPSQPSRSTLDFIGTAASQLPLLINAAITILALLLVFALRYLLRLRRDRSRRDLATWQGLQAQRGLVSFSEKSRGVSNNAPTVMSTSPRPDYSHSNLDFTPGGRSGEIHNHHSWPRNLAHTYREETMASPVKDTAGMEHHLRSRPPPPPPLTPPTLSSTLFPFQDRRLSSTISMMGDLDSSFFQQPNPDYTSSTTSSSSSSSSSSSALPQGRGDSPVTPRRRSYTKMLPLGPPQPVSILEDDGSITAFSPSSFPSSSPILPLAPHSSFHATEIDVKGEIISVMDDSGAGWKRHTRVYGGGVCLACMAAGSEGGFYGDRVRPEEKR
ncbi:hypothetical protein BX600DRAFT_434732 [Xylariales sp. PMI_506]|nr:hypothetical protein BX600DRAFT_434732 [Xylariales sp. PMI_506]